MITILSRSFNVSYVCIVQLISAESHDFPPCLPALALAKEGPCPGLSPPAPHSSSAFMFISDYTHVMPVHFPERSAARVHPRSVRRLLAAGI